ncbi:MAG: YbaB/EbfC family nucleoid-associated protein [Caldilineales bacterium]|nr:YbaB/EbfC family nucleoid-associated protein [Caldilineales bacterium]
MPKKRHAPRGYRPPGSGGGSNPMLSQIQQLQQAMAAAQSALAELTVEATAGGGMVTVVANGQQEILAITIRPEVVDPDEVEMLQDLILAAVNQALEKSRALAGEQLGGLTQGLNLPAGFPGLF